MQLRAGWRFLLVTAVAAAILLSASVAAGSLATAKGSEMSAGSLRPASRAAVMLGGSLGLIGSPSKMESLNWAGYADVDKSKGHITQVFAEWDIPTASCPTNAPGRTEQVQWVGIDGLGSSTVEQIGTYDFCSGPGATPTYATWWEFYPTDALHKYRAASAGDLIQAYVLYNPDVNVGGTRGLFTMILYDLTAGYGFTKVGNPSAASDVSAECISEAPVSSSGVISALTDYGTASFLSCDATINGTFAGIGGYAIVYAIDQVNGSSKTLQSVSGLSRVDYPLDHFVVTWKAYA